MKKVLVTGANGFVGSYVVEQLLQKDFVVIATGKGKNRLLFQDQHLTYAEMDITNDDSVISVFQKYQPDIVIHSAAISKPDECESNRELAYSINVQGTINLLDAAKKYQSFFIFLSTDFVFDGEKGMYQEDDKRKSVNYYGETKILAEDEVTEYEYDWAIVRTVLVYGASFSGGDNIVTSVAKALKKGEKLNIYDDQVRTPTYVADLARAIVTIAEKKATGIFHISGKDVRTPYQIAIEVAKHLGFNEQLITKASRATFTQPALRPLKTGFDISKAERELNYQPISFEDGLRKTLELLTTDNSQRTA